MVKKIILKCLLLLLIVSVLNLVYSATLYPRDLREKSKEIVEIRESQPTTDIYYFGESSNNTFIEEDSLKNSISELVAMHYPSLVLKNINKNATHAGIYREWLKQLRSGTRLPAAVIVTMNLRSFNAAWRNSDLETQLRESLVFGRPLPEIVNRFLLSLQAFDNASAKQRDLKTQEEWQTKTIRFPYPFKYQTVAGWDRAMAMGGYLLPDGSWDTKKIELACHFIKAYAINLDAQNERIADFDAIFNWCNDHKVELYLNLMAENIEFADSLVGKDLVFLMQQNRNYLVQRYHKNNCKVIDNLTAVPGEEFIDKNWTTEHYKFKGRRIIAKNVSDTLKAKFKKEYKKAF